jgi:hypothetical protein
MKKFIEFLVIFFVFVFGVFLGYFYSGINSKNQKNINDTYQAGWSAARIRLIESGYFSDQLGQDIYPITSVSGKIISLGNSQFSIKINTFDPLSDPDLDIRTVITENNTKIYKISEKDLESYSKEVKEFLGKYPQYKDMPDAPIGQPTKFFEKPITVNEIVSNDRVVVEASKDIRNAKEIVAKKITVQN